MHRIHNRKAFTLIEMILAVIIVALMVAVAYAHYNSSVEKGKETAVMNNMEALFTSANMYYANKGTVSDLTCDKLVSENLIQSCPNGPDKDATYTFSTTTNGNIEITYTGGGKTMKMSEMQKKKEN